MRSLQRLRPGAAIALPPVEQLATIVVPSRYPDIFERCSSSLAEFAPNVPKFLVRDGWEIAPPKGWNILQGPDGPFVYARNVNIALRSVYGDILLMNDDARFIQASTLEIMQSVLALRPDIGILSPLVDGVANGVGHTREVAQVTNHYLSFVCVLIRRAVVDKVGLLDESFTGYGSEDVDYCRRTQAAGFSLAVTALATVAHTHGSSSYNREADIEAKRQASAKQYLQKWGRKTQGHYADEQ
jgi:hypothetical protein